MKETISQRARRLNYPANLIEPIFNRAPLKVGLLSGMIIETTETRKWEILREKFESLLNHYKIQGKSYDDLLNLAFKLALDWVPGFSVVEDPPRGPGAPKLNEEDTLVKTYKEIEQFRQASKSKHIGKACAKFLDKHKSESRWTRISSRALENLYNKGRKISAQREQSAKTFHDLQKGLLDTAFKLSEGGLFRLGANHAAGKSSILDRIKKDD